MNVICATLGVDCSDMQKPEIEEAAQLMQQHGVLEPQQLVKIPALTAEVLRELLIRQVNYMLERDFERLLQSLYRIDVSEQKFRESLTSEDPAGQIADLILQREMMKVQTRRWYASRLTSDN